MSFLLFIANTFQRFIFLKKSRILILEKCKHSSINGSLGSKAFLKEICFVRNDSEPSLHSHGTNTVRRGRNLSVIGKGGCTSFSLLNCRWEQHLRCDLAKRWCYIWKLLHPITIAETTMGMVPKSTEDGLEKVEMVALDRQPYRLSYKPICVSKMESRNWNTIVDLYLGIGRPGFSFRFCQ